MLVFLICASILQLHIKPSYSSESNITGKQVMTVRRLKLIHDHQCQRQKIVHNRKCHINYHSINILVLSLLILESNALAFGVWYFLSLNCSFIEFESSML